MAPKLLATMSTQPNDHQRLTAPRVLADLPHAASPDLKVLHLHQRLVGASPDAKETRLGGADGKVSGPVVFAARMPRQSRATSARESAARDSAVRDSGDYGGAVQGEEMPVRVIRSAKRKKTIQARVENGTLVVRMPMHISEEEAEQHIASLRQRVEKKMSRARRRGSDEDLAARAERLNERFLQGRARMTSIRWVSNQNSRWGSCTPSTGAIRISDKLQSCPDYVIDAVVIHELAHTFCAGGHDREFWSWADRAPHAERAKGFLEGFARANAADVGGGVSDAWDEEES